MGNIVDTIPVKVWGLVLSSTEKDVDRPPFSYLGKLGCFRKRFTIYHFSF
jgi:hypothetical protein